MSADALALLLRSFKLPTMAARYAETLVLKKYITDI